MAAKNLTWLADFLPGAPVHDHVPPGLSTGETWMLHRRKALPQSRSAAFFRPEDFVPEPFGYRQGIPLYRFDQTRNYNPRPETVAAQQYYDYFVASQNRHRYSLWDSHPNGKPTWLAEKVSQH
jgi:hypothetical protein